MLLGQFSVTEAPSFGEEAGGLDTTSNLSCLLNVVLGQVQFSTAGFTIMLEILPPLPFHIGIIVLYSSVCTI